jgi:hypothetical protein
MILFSSSTRADEGDEGSISFVPCEQVDLQGTWSVRVGAKDEFGNHLCWESCSLTVDALGIVEASGTYEDCSEVTSDIAGGELTISSGCVIEGTIETSNGTVNVATGAIVGNELVLGRAGE